VAHKIYIHESCYSIDISKDDAKNIVRRPFVLACGEVLEVGDKFTEIHSHGSAGVPPIKLAAGWYQEFKGFFKLKDKWHDTILALFDARKIATSESIFTNEHRYIAYTPIESQGKLSFWTHIQSLRVCCCTGITRYNG
jgi:hypothetical protein